VLKQNVLREKSQIKHFKEKKTDDFYWEIFSPTYWFQNTCEINEKRHFEKFRAKILVQESVSTVNPYPNPKKKNFGSTTQTET
jgi:hypothetical protein